MSQNPGIDTRIVTLADALSRVRRRMADACLAAGRDPAEVTLIAVTKHHPAEDVVRLAALGVTEVGENRDQEARAKAAAVAAARAGVRWHFIGQLQRNKCRSVAQYAAAVHSVDSVALAGALGQAVARAERPPLDVLVQVSLDGDPTRGGAVPSGAGDTDLGRVCAAVAGDLGLTLRGLMVVAPIGWDPQRAFGRIEEIAAVVRGDHPGAKWLSAGMSGDLEIAVLHGSTHVRVGSALLGKRGPLR